MSGPISDTISVVDLGLLPYSEALALQRELCRERLGDRSRDDILLLVEHPSVITLGRGSKESSLPFPRSLLASRGLEVFEVERGGDVTLHAPGQLVGYPIFDLGGWRHDLHWYLRQIEEVMIRGVLTLGIRAGRNPGKTGVWTEGRKIASIGIHVKQWVTLHGFALNVSTDLGLFDLIVPCGISGVTMTSVERELPDGGPYWDATRAAVIAGFGEVFERKMVPGTVAAARGNLPSLESVSGT